MTPDRAARADTAVRATIDFLAVIDGPDHLCRADRYLAIHRPDHSRCVSCGRPYPCSLVAIAVTAQQLSAKRTARALRRVLAGEMRPRRAGAA